MLFKAVDLARRTISKFPQGLKRLTATVVALFVYWPLARISKLLTKIGKDTSNFPLRHYADMPFIMMANDALDRFRTTLEKCFSKDEIMEMLRTADFDTSTLKFSDTEPF